LPILEAALHKLKVLPKRTFESVDEFIEFAKAHKDIIIDATERLHHRKKNQQEQKNDYSIMNFQYLNNGLNNSKFG